MIVTRATVLTRYRANGAAFHASTKLSSVSGAVGTKRAENSRGWNAVHTAYASGSSHSAPSSQAASVSARRPGALTGRRGGPRHGPPNCSSEGGYAPLGLPRPTLGRAPAEPWRASELPQVGSLLLDVDLGARAKTKMTVGDHALTGLQPAHDDGLGAQAGARLHL